MLKLPVRIKRMFIKWWFHHAAFITMPTSKTDALLSCFFCGIVTKSIFLLHFKGLFSSLLWWAYTDHFDSLYNVLFLKHQAMGKKERFFLSSNIILLFLWVLVLRTRLRSLSTQHLLSGILNSNSFSKLKAVALKLHLSQFKNEISIIRMSWGHKYITRNTWRQGGKCLSY